ncbi:MAG: peptidylprolyl isomerase [Myxococcales bacterium]|nr:MAG: peptidylprolyl isomerase [Myxococcales bacterium]
MKRAVIELDSGDKIEIELFDKEAPKTVANFEKLASEKYYDGLSFHRVISGFMSQGGCPDGTGSGGPGYTIPCETGPSNPHKHEAGSLSMAHRGPNTGGSQFFICHAPQPHLNGVHTVFGKVTSGLSAVTSMKGGEKMTTVRIETA